jgi:lysophospholipase L1-like esterase
MKHNPYILLFLITIACMPLLSFKMEAAANDALIPKDPLRLGSCGDSITVGMNAELPGENHNASWVNGYFGFWQWLLWLTNVNSHNQRIDDAFVDSYLDRLRRRNFMFAEQGADSFDFADQARQAVDNQVEYVTVFLGHNDVCQNDPLNIPDIDTFEANMRAGLDILRGGGELGPGLPYRAAVYIVGIVDIQQLRTVADDKRALGIVDCEVLWALSLLDLYPCASILNPFAPPNALAVTLNADINEMLSDLVDEYNTDDTDHVYYYTNSIFDFVPFLESDVSNIDCFHPSAQGQRVIAEETWLDGPFYP